MGMRSMNKRKMLNQRKMRMNVALIALGAVGVLSVGCGPPELGTEMDEAASAAEIGNTSQAVSSHGPGYPAYLYEGLFPTQTPCSGRFALKQSRTASFGGRTITLKYFYHGSCGSF